MIKRHLLDSTVISGPHNLAAQTDISPYLVCQILLVFPVFNVSENMASVHKRNFNHDRYGFAYAE